MPGLLALLLLLAAPPELTLRRQVFDSPLTIHVSARTAGAIDSLTFRGKEFVNAHDHGREWQSAVSYDQLGECLNPTEGGSNQDGAGPVTSSEWIDAHVTGGSLFTTTKMAYWLKPEEPHAGGCGGSPKVRTAQNKTVLSEDTVLKQITIGHGGQENVIEYFVTLNVSEAHKSAVFEAATGYMPPEFSVFQTFQPGNAQLAGLTNGPGEQNLPLVFSTRDGRSAVGIYSPEPNPGYGRFLFLQRPESASWNAAKWNVVFRRGPVAPGPYTFRCFLAIGTVEEVRKALQVLTAPAL